jgi:hypothetical protein
MKKGKYYHFNDMNANDYKIYEKCHFIVMCLIKQFRESGQRVLRIWYLYLHKNLVFISLFHFQTRYGQISAEKTDITCPIVLMDNYFIDKFSEIMHSIIRIDLISNTF